MMKPLKKKGQTAMMSVIGLIVLIGVAIITMVFIGVMAGRTYETSETHITDITNQTIEDHVRNGIVETFQAYEDIGSFMPLIVLALVVILILSLIFGLLAFQQIGGAGGRGSVL